VVVKRRKRGKKRKKLSVEERRTRKIQRDHKKEVRSIFSALAFDRITSVSEREFSFQGTTSDFDDLFIFENLVVLVEYTTAQESGISDHLKGKRSIFAKISAEPRAFVEFLGKTFPEFRSKKSDDFTLSRMRVVIVYCALNSVRKMIKSDFSDVKFLDFQVVKYFVAVTKAIRESARSEFCYFLGLAHTEVGQNALSPRISAGEGYAASLLPEDASHFPDGYKVISFYVDPEALLARSYVLRQDRWEERSNLYQRMIDKRKIDAIRGYLLKDGRVFVNNIIVTLPETTELRDARGRPLDVSTVTQTTPITVRLPSEYNSIGLVDGQHRVYSYYKGGDNEERIGRLRRQQNLLATGIIYPESTTPAERIKFEAQLFYEINSNQTKAKSDVKQAIELLLNPYSPDSIAKDIVNRLNDHGPLSDKFERFFFEKGKLKTTSVVSYGIRHVVKLSGTDTLFETWDRADKQKLERKRDLRLRNEYVEYCVQQLNEFIGAVKDSLPRDRWTTNKKEDGLLTTTNLVGFIVCLRKIIARGRTHRFLYYRQKLEGLQGFNFDEYHSSQYVRMGEELYNTYFSRTS
jgi:DGQHR domain-containing protein